MEGQFRTIEEVLRADSVSQDDKRRIIECYAKVKLYADCGVEYVRGNTSLNFPHLDVIEVYKVNPDKSLTWIKNLKASDYHFVGLSHKVVTPKCPVYRA